MVKESLEIRQVQALISSQSWVASVWAQPVNGQSAWQIVGTDEVIESQIMRPALLDPALGVKDFEGCKHRLEEIFLNRVGEGDHGKQ